MIRSTRNETISTVAKQRHNGAALLAGVYPRGETYSLVKSTVGDVTSEVRDAFNAHSTTITDFPSNNFNGSFE